MNWTWIDRAGRDLQYAAGLRTRFAERKQKPETNDILLGAEKKTET